LVEFDVGIEGIRKETGYKPGDELKFETNARPIDVTIEQARQAKERGLEAFHVADIFDFARRLHREGVRAQPARAT
jgi:hypothetical protein